MPTEEFLARLVKSRTAGASVIAVDEVEEKGPEAISQSVPPSSKVAKVRSYGSDVAKERDRKRHRDSTTSRSHHSKKLKNPMTCSNLNEALGVGKIGSESCVAVSAGTGVSGGYSQSGIIVCKEYVEKLSSELEKLLTLGEVVDVGEVSRLRSEVVVLRASKLDLEKASDVLTKENNASADRIFSLLSEKSELIGECDSLGVKVKEQEVEVCEVKAALDACQKDLADKESSWNAEKVDMLAKLGETAAQLARCQAESLKSFEDGYGECINHFAGAGIDVKGHEFENYLGDLQDKVEAGKTGSSKHSGED